MAQCMAMGQVRQAAALCTSQKQSPRELEVTQLQHMLRENGAILL